MDNVFSKIIRGEIPCYKIYEDDKNLAFLDIAPESKGHTLVIPKVEVDKVYELEDEDYDALFHAVKKIAKHMEEVLGTRILMKVVGTDVPHAHVHLMPLDPMWKHGRTLELSEAEFKEIQAKLAF
ncbi:HIT domain-containing protein [Candidatus Saccharibacteria bacterium]|nr:HIT domain-containing protein [Candidatus Saccharibacteria bacterium]